MSVRANDSYAVRRATEADAEFLMDMLVEAANWESHRNRSRVDIMADPALAHYVSAWMRPTDLGVVAVVPSGQSIGAAWLRYLPAADPGYGYIRDDVPELSIGVVAAWRGRGVGRALLRQILATARAAGVSAVSLSVEPANFAVRLYLAEGFRIVESSEHAYTMMAELEG
jgi:ribosomal protein S18 acetylase RimI-like enzyme